MVQGLWDFSQAHGCLLICQNSGHRRPHCSRLLPLDGLVGGSLDGLPSSLLSALGWRQYDPEISRPWRPVALGHAQCKLRHLLSPSSPQVFSTVDHSSLLEWNYQSPNTTTVKGMKNNLPIYKHGQVRDPRLCTRGKPWPGQNRKEMS